MTKTKQNNRPRPMVLIILDGWGYSENPQHNAILSANKPTWDKLWAQYPHTLITGSGHEVGLPANQMGNSEVGHLNLGSGRIVPQEYTRIENAIVDKSFTANQVITDAIDRAIDKRKAIHILGLLSPGGVHSHEDQIHTLIKLCASRGATNINLHAFLDGRDTPPKSAATSIKKIEDIFSSLGCGKIISMIGRYFAMDRDNRWQRVQKAHDLLTKGIAEHQATSALASLEQAYERNETDEFVKATAIIDEDQQATHIQDGDTVIFMNFRADRARQLTRALIEEDFLDFERLNAPKLGSFVSLTEYNKAFKVPVAFPPEHLDNVFGDYIAQRGLQQLRIAETEKYAHVTFFFNGGIEESFEGEDRVLIASPKVATYDLKPEMSAPMLTDKLVEAIDSETYDTIICNYANPDMVGHSGKFDATVKAIEAIDACLGRVVEALHRVGGEVIITADHGNAECLFDENTQQPHTAHTTNPVPLIYMGRPASITDGGSLSDVTPTMLYLMGLAKPAEMTGQSLVEICVETRPRAASNQ